MMTRVLVGLVFALVLMGLIHLTHGQAGPNIWIEEVTVLTDEEAIAAGFPMHYASIRYVYENVPSNQYKIRVSKFDDSDEDRVGFPPYLTFLITDYPDNIWYDPDANIDAASERYFLEILDENDRAVASASNNHGTILLGNIQQSEIDICSATILFEWNNYQYNETLGEGLALQPFFTHNRIMVLPPGETDEIVVVELPFEETSYDLSFDHGPGDYRIRVRAVEFEPGTETVRRYSNSNARIIPFVRPALDDLSINYVTVAENRDIDLGFSVLGVPGDISEFNYQVFRATAIGEDPELLGDASWDPLQGMFIFTDESAPQFDEGPVFYQVKAHITECEETFEYESDMVSSLYLEASIDGYIGLDPVIGFSWEQYPDGVGGFRLYRRLQNESEFSQVATDLNDVPDDDLSLLPQPVSGEVFYYVEADYNGYTITSNITSVVIERELEIPNAFRPLSDIPENQTFKPSLPGGFIPSEYRLTIYNRWGQEMFVVDNPGHGWAGWNGTDSDGREVQQGVYGFRLEYQVGTGPREEVMGTVMLIR